MPISKGIAISAQETVNCGLVLRGVVYTRGKMLPPRICTMPGRQMHTTDCILSGYARRNSAKRTLTTV